MTDAERVAQLESAIREYLLARKAACYAVEQPALERLQKVVDPDMEVK